MHIENGAKECKTFNAQVIYREERGKRGDRGRQELQLQLPGTRIYLTNSKKLLLPAKNPAGRVVSKGIAQHKWKWEAGSRGTKGKLLLATANGKRTFVMLKQKNTKLYLTAPRTPSFW